MDSEELENKTQDKPTEKTDSNREGYAKPAGYQREYRSDGRPQRPRIHVQRSYPVSKPVREEGGFRPEGFGAGLQSSGSTQQPQRRTFRPRTNNNSEGGYQPRQSYGHQSYRPNNYRQGSDQQQGGYQPRGNYRPRYNSNDAQGQGGYQPRGSYNRNGGYQPRGGYNRDGGYNNDGNFNRQGNFNRGGYGKSSYNRPGGYSQGGYRQHSSDYDPNAKYSLKKRIRYKEDHIDPNEPIRLNKYLANAGVCSRREADEYIQAGVVTVNGEVVTELGTKVHRSDEVKFHDQPVSLEQKVYVLLNKPKGYVTTSDDPQQRKTVMDLVKDACPERIYPVGRLDRNTTGVLLLTNDGDLASKLTHPKFLKKKVYHVTLDKNVSEQDIQKIAEGVELEDGEVHADAIEYASETDKSQVGIEIHSGKNRIVRRIFESLGYRVVKLDRVLFAGLTKKNLRRGDWRFLTEKEVDMLRMGAFE